MAIKCILFVKESPLTCVSWCRLCHSCRIRASLPGSLCTVVWWEREHCVRSSSETPRHRSLSIWCCTSSSDLSRWTADCRIVNRQTFEYKGNSARKRNDFKNYTLSYKLQICSDGINNWRNWRERRITSKYP